MTVSTAVPLAALINWSGLGLVALFAVVAGTVIVGAFSIALMGLDRWAGSRETSGSGHSRDRPAATPTGDVSRAATPISTHREQVAYGSLAMAVIGFAVCVLAVGLGIWSMVVK